jgi:hypothetical protein
MFSHFSKMGKQVGKHFELRILKIESNLKKRK